MPDYYSEGNLIVRTDSYEEKKEEPKVKEEVNVWKEKVSGNNKDPEKFKETDFPSLEWRTTFQSHSRS